jgi:hypothetical protein
MEDVMTRYKMIADTTWHPAIYRVVDTDRPAEVIAGFSRGGHKVVCECADEGDAMMIADALNKADD